MPLFPGVGAEVTSDDRLRLREFLPDDAAWYRGLYEMDEMWRFTGGWAFPRLDQAQWMVNWFLEEAEREPRSKFFFVCESAEREPIGFCQITELSYRVCDVGWYLTPESWGRGLGTRVAQLLIGWAFTGAGFHRAQATAHPQNTASLRIIEKLGFEEVGMVRDYCAIRDFVQGTEEWQDRLLYSTTAKGYPQVGR